ncbi:hypothetical protein NliqN6_3161 [Naganishia liquefaciens]|uniref:Uncharacterized protein n=1 Tax=Naganishia liquefaciens TaxID=104408 RepID=A0A8H3TTI4_9TREE|nr:hypothetical protein NliqN6_3161 [Naganishia liquefaciens]
MVTTAPTRTSMSSSFIVTDSDIALAKRCNEGETCPEITAGPEVPIAVTTTMATTKIVSCTTTTTVIDSQTSTLTLWSTEVQTSTEHIQGAATVTVWLVTPAPEIKSKTWHQEETYTFVRTGTSTSFWTETQPVQTSATTISGPVTTWTDGGKHDSTDCRDCQRQGSPPAPTVSPPTSSSPPGLAPAWTHTAALVGSTAQPGRPDSALFSQGSPSAVGWMGTPQGSTGGASSPYMGAAAMAHVGEGPPSGSGTPLPNFNNPQGSAMPPQLSPNPAGQGAAAPISPFSSAGMADHVLTGATERLLVCALSAVVGSAVLL